MADISNVVTVTALLEPALALRDNINVVMVITSQLGVLNSANRYKSYANAQEVAVDFGTESEVYHYALTFFSTSPNATNADGLFLVGYWRAVDENTPATSAVLTGAELSEAVVLGQLQTVTNGSFNITVDGGLEQNIVGLDFQTSTSLLDIVDVINVALSDATATLENNAIVITSLTTGVTSTLTYLTDPNDASVFVGNILNLSSSSGATLAQGADAGVISAETKLAAVTELKAKTNMYGAIFIDKPTASDAGDLAEWAQANDTLLYDVFFDPSNLEVDMTNIVWTIAISGYSNYRCLFSTSNDRRFGVSYMARAHTVNFNVPNSALTMNLKSLPIAPESYTQTEINKAKQVGLDLYTFIKNEGVILTSGKNDFVDNRYNLLGYINAVQIDVFNLLKGTSTKIPQTIRGVNAIVDQVEKTTQQFVTAGIFAAGTWTSPDTFGDLSTFKRSIESNGYYVLAGRLSDQPQPERQQRKSPPIQVACKFSGAIHSVDIIINFNL